MDFFEIDVPFYAQDDRRHETMIDRKSVKTDQATNGVVLYSRPRGSLKHGGMKWVVAIMWAFRWTLRWKDYGRDIF